MIPLPFSLKDLSATTVFLAIFGIILGSFLLFNSSTILTTLGFETTTNLKAKLAKTEEALQQAKDLNKANEKEIQRLKQINETNLQALAQANQEISEAKQTVATLQKQRSDKKKENTKTVDAGTVVTDTTITLPRQAYDALSIANIQSIQEAYQKLSEPSIHSVADDDIPITASSLQGPPEGLPEPAGVDPQSEPSVHT